ncbi:MAG: PAS domain S-box protein [Candidatus Thorarchaeota archaeon]
MTDKTPIKSEEQDQSRDDLLRYRALVDSMSEGFGVVDKNNVFTYVNKRLAEMLGYSVEEMIGRKLTDFLDDKNKAIIAENVKKRKEGLSSQYEIAWTTVGGKNVPTIISGAPLIDNGEHVGSFAVITDISAHVEALNFMKESETRYRALSEQSLQGLAVIQDDRYAYVNPAFASMIGYSVDEIRAMSSEDQWNLVHPDDQKMLLERAKARREGKDIALPYQYRFAARDGSVKWVEAFAGYVEYDGREATQILAIDITEKLEAERELRDSQEMLRLVMTNIPQYVFWKDTDSVYLGCNDNFARVAGVDKPENIVGKTDFDLVWTKEESDRYRTVDRRVIDNDKAEFRIVSPQQQADGKQAWIETNLVPLHNPEGIVIGILGTYEDVTERKEAEESIRNSEMKYRTLAEQSLQGLNLMIDGMFAYVNRAFCDMVGYSEDELLKMQPKEVWNLIHIEDQPILDQRKRDRAEGRSTASRSEYRLVRKDGSIRWVESFTSTLEYTGKQATQTVLIDITERYLAEKDVRTEKDRATLYLDLMGHDIRNLLQVILNGATLLRTAKDDVVRSSFLSIIEDSVQRASRIIEEVRATEHLLTTAMEKRPLKSSIQIIVDAIANRVEKAEFNIELGKSDAEIMADGYLELLLSNIIMNAIEHNPRDKKRVWVKLEGLNNGFAVSISDNGPGISISTKASLFDMARRFGGVGLHQSNQIIEKYGGHIEVFDRVEGKPSEGALFRIWFPKP